MRSNPARRSIRRYAAPDVVSGDELGPAGGFSFVTKASDQQVQAMLKGTARIVNASAIRVDHDCTQNVVRQDRHSSSGVVFPKASKLQQVIQPLRRS
jgi:hypothetical protein